MREARSRAPANGRADDAGTPVCKAVSRFVSVASHLKIDLGDYDERIRTFIPWYDEMLDAAASAVALVRATPAVVVDLGIGTGALAERCLRANPSAALVGVDADGEILAAAGRRLRKYHRRVSVTMGDFERMPLMRADAFVASLSLHHIPTRARKRRVYQRVFAALRRGGILVTADCAPAADARTAAAQHASWRSHMLRTYDRGTTASYFRAWARDDVYMPLATELALLAQAGFSTELWWRRGPFAVIAARRHR